MIRSPCVCRRSKSGSNRFTRSGIAGQSETVRLGLLAGFYVKNGYARVGPCCRWKVVLSLRSKIYLLRNKYVLIVIRFIRLTKISDAIFSGCTNKFCYSKEWFKLWRRITRNKCFQPFFGRSSTAEVITEPFFPIGQRSYYIRPAIGVIIHI